MPTTHLAVILDESGSMAISQLATISGFNEYIDSLKADQAPEPMVVSLTKFCTTFTKLWSNLPLADVPLLNTALYQPDGLTALYDAIAHTLMDLEPAVQAADRVLCVILTDGQENSSKENTRDQIFAMIDERQKRGNWTFVFLGANQDSWATGAALGMVQGNVQNYQHAHIDVAFHNLAGATRSYTGRQDRAVSNFWENSGDDPQRHP